MLSDMDALSFDGYTSYSDSSAPRTPSPRADLPYPSPTQIYDEEGNVGAPSGYRGSLLQELYGQEEEYHKQQLQQQHSQLPPASSHPIMPRRATFPYVRHDAPSYPPTYDVYEESYTVVPSNGPSGPTSYYQTPHNPYLQQHQQSSQHHLSYGPSSSGMLPAPNMGMGGMPGMPMGPYGHLHPVPPVQHTDDAASKETQYLRRRCFNCHTTEPPSWRRSTLNPGKIVCNKCGLYERTHLRPRPLRFDELRAGGKSRKNSLSNGSGGNGKTSPKSPGKSVVKKESVDVGLGRIRGNRRSSVSSSAGSGSDWDDNASIYSSANNSAFNSPAGMLGHQQLPSLSPQPPHLGLGLNSGYNSNSNGFTPSDSPSPPLSSAGIRLPNAPLSDIAEYRSNSGNINGEYNSGEYIEYNEYDRNSNEPELGYPESYDSPYLNNYNRLPTSVSPSPHPRTPHSLPLPLSSTNSPYSGSSHLGSPHLGSPHLGSPGNMVPSPLAEAQLLQSQASAGSSSNGSTSTLMDIYSSPETLVNPDSANTKISPMLMPPSLSRELTVPVGSGQRNKSHTISTSTPYEAYLNASREARGQERMLYGTPRERSGSVSSVYSTHSASSASSAHSSRASSILLSAHSVHASLPEIEGEDTVLVSVSGSMDELHMGLGGLHEMHETLDPSVLNGERV